MELRKTIRKKMNGIIFVIIMIAILRKQVLAVSREELANPVRDVSTHFLDYKKKNENGSHKTQYHYVYFGSYPKGKLETLLL